MSPLPTGSTGRRYRYRYVIPTLLLMSHAAEILPVQRSGGTWQRLGTPPCSSTWPDEGHWPLSLRELVSRSLGEQTGALEYKREGPKNKREGPLPARVLVHPRSPLLPCRCPSMAWWPGVLPASRCHTYRVSHCLGRVVATLCKKLCHHNASSSSILPTHAPLRRVSATARRPRLRSAGRVTQRRWAAGSTSDRHLRRQHARQDRANDGSGTGRSFS